MKSVVALVVILGAMLAVLGIIASVPNTHQEAVTLMAVVLVAAVTIILRGPLGRALAGSLTGDDPQKGEAIARLTAQVEDALDEARAARQDTLELQERLDFAERLLASQSGRHVPLEDGRDPAP